MVATKSPMARTAYPSSAGGSEVVFSASRKPELLNEMDAKLRSLLKNFLGTSELEKDSHARYALLLNEVRLFEQFYDEQLRKIDDNQRFLVRTLGEMLSQHKALEDHEQNEAAAAHAKTVVSFIQRNWKSMFLSMVKEKAYKHFGDDVSVEIIDLSDLDDDDEAIVRVIVAGGRPAVDREKGFLHDGIAQELELLRGTVSLEIQGPPAS